MEDVLTVIKGKVWQVIGSITLPRPLQAMKGEEWDLSLWEEGSECLLLRGAGVILILLSNRLS